MTVVLSYAYNRNKAAPPEQGLYGKGGPWIPQRMLHALSMIPQIDTYITTQTKSLTPPHQKKKSKLLYESSIMCMQMCFSYPFVIHSVCIR